MLRHFSQLFSLTTPALLTTMSMWENVDLVCLKVSENCRKKYLYPRILKIEEFNQLIWNTSSPFLKWSPSSSFPLVTSHLLAITKPSPYWFFHSVTVRCKLFSLMSAAQTCRQMSTYQYKPTNVSIQESLICICTLFQKKKKAIIFCLIKITIWGIKIISTMTFGTDVHVYFK